MTVSGVDPLDPAELSAALICWTGWEDTPWPQRDERRLTRQFGSEATADLLPQLRKLEDDFYATDARFVAPDLETMGRIAADQFRRQHPEISDGAVQALAWCYTWDYK
jgi:hypothetical protein